MDLVHTILPSNTPLAYIFIEFSFIDPLKLGQLLCGSSEEKKLTLQTVEMFNGRMSMLATVGYSVQEYYTGMPVVRETPQFFTPWLSSFSSEAVVVASAASSHGVM